MEGPAVMAPAGRYCLAARARWRRRMRWWRDALRLGRRGESVVVRRQRAARIVGSCGEFGLRWWARLVGFGFSIDGSLWYGDLPALTGLEYET